MKAYKIFLGRKEIDKIFLNDNNTDSREDIKRSLVNHDGYDPGIRVVKEQNNPRPKKPKPTPAPAVKEYTDTDKDRIGQQIAALLELRRDWEHRDRYRTTWGTKTNTGIFEIIRRLGRAIEDGRIEEDLK